jgi:endonuclease III
MKLHLEEVIPVMLSAAERPLTKQWAVIAPEIAIIQAQHDSAWMGRDDSRDALDQAREKAIERLAVLEGVGRDTAALAVNNAMCAVTGIVNQAVGFHLIE